jgi:hypothetical protein
MAKPPGRCVFCEESGNLTKGHIWPDSFGRSLGDARYHKKRLGKFFPSNPIDSQQGDWERMGTGPLQKKRPRNTCSTCNGGWMSRIENATASTVKAIIDGRGLVMGPVETMQLAGMLALVSARLELSTSNMRTIPASELQSLRATALPNFLSTFHWRIWIGRFLGEDLRDHNYRYNASLIAPQSAKISIAEMGPERCNTHVATIISGQLYAHVFFSTDWPNFCGQKDVRLSQIWPPVFPYLDTRFLPTITDSQAISVQGAIRRFSENGAFAELESEEES